MPEGVHVGRGLSQRLQGVRNLFKVLSSNFDISYESFSLFRNRPMFVIEYKIFKNSHLNRWVKIALWDHSSV